MFSLFWLGGCITEVLLGLTVQFLSPLWQIQVTMIFVLQRSTNNRESCDCLGRAVREYSIGASMQVNILLELETDCVYCCEGLDESQATTRNPKP